MLWPYYAAIAQWVMQSERDPHCFELSYRLLCKLVGLVQSNGEPSDNQAKTAREHIDRMERSGLLFRLHRGEKFGLTTLFTVVVSGHGLQHAFELRALRPRSIRSAGKTVTQIAT